MKRFFQTNIICVLLLTLLVSGCSRRMIDFTVISSKNMQLQIPPEAMGGRVEGEDKVFIVFGFRLGTPNLKEAVDRAIENAGPGYDALIDGVLYQTTDFYLLVLQTGYKVVGTPIKTSLVHASLPKGDSRLARASILYHSSRGISNEAALANLKIVKGDKPNTSD